MIGRIAALIAPLVQAAKLAAWPVGSIYMSLQATSPATLFGGTWERVANGRMLIGADSASYPAGSTGGACADGGGNACAQPHHRILTGWKPSSGHWKRNLWTKHGDDHPTNHINGRSGLLCNRDTDARRRAGAHQHAAVAGRSPLEARGVRQAARKGAAV